MKKRMRKLIPLMMAVLLVLSVVLAGCGSSSKEAMDSMSAPGAMANGSYGSMADTKGEAMFDGDYAVEEEMESATADSMASTSSSGSAAEQKIILYLDYEIETLEFDKSAAALENLCAQLGGYVQDSYRSGDSINYENLHHASYTFRIPKERLEEFRKGAEGVGTVTSVSTRSDNVTEHYYDIESRLASLRTQEERLLALMEKSETLTDVIELEQALANVTYEIESLTSSLRRYDSLVDYSTVTVRLSEVVKYSETPVVARTIWQRMGTRFTRSVENIAEFGEDLLVGIVGSLPVLVLLAVLFCIVFFPIRAVFRKLKAKRQTKKAPAVPEKTGE
ncbi:MAG: DUF4349 domain-containing protein [Oscillospiraceae bacterium]|nr:DUF4349 domain-containing protein [Oscillospiraceae bacterium]